MKIEITPLNATVTTFISILVLFVILLIGKIDGNGNSCGGFCQMPFVQSACDKLDITANCTGSVRVNPYFDSEKYYEVSEPSSAYLFGFGGLFLIARQRRNRKT